MMANPFASRHKSTSLQPGMRDSTTQLSMKIRKIMPDHQKNMIVSNVNAVGSTDKFSRNFKKT